MPWTNEQRRARYHSDPDYAAKVRASSLAAKRKRRGVCEKCGGETRYNGSTVNGPSRICADCAKPAEPGHGTFSRYSSAKWRCRCELCRAANAAKAREWYRKQRAGA